MVNPLVHNFVIWPFFLPVTDLVKFSKPDCLEPRILVVTSFELNSMTDIGYFLDRSNDGSLIFLKLFLIAKISATVITFYPSPFLTFFQFTKPIKKLMARFTPETFSLWSHNSCIYLHWGTALFDLHTPSMSAPLPKSSQIFCKCFPFFFPWSPQVD